MSKRTQRSHFLKIGVVSCSKPKGHERERERDSSRNPRTWLSQRAKLVRVNTAPFESIGPGTLSFTSITLSVLLSIHLKLSCLFLSASLKLNFQTPSSQIRAGYCKYRWLHDRRKSDVSQGDRYRIAWLCVITHKHTQTYTLYFSVHSVHYNSIFTIWNNKAHNCYSIHSLISKTLNSYMFRLYWTIIRDSGR
jgi:hypothetical protein